MRILIIEDEEILLKVLKDRFEKSGFEVEIAADGEQAMPAVKRFQPDIILLDLILPKKDGFAILQELKADAELRPIPVIVLSNLSQDEDIKKAFKMGAVDYFVKTQHSSEEIVERVKNRLLGKRTQSR